MTHFFFVTDSAPMSASPRMIELRERIAFGQIAWAADSSFFRSDSLMRMVAETVRLDTARMVTFIPLAGKSYIGSNGYFVVAQNGATTATDKGLAWTQIGHSIKVLKVLPETSSNIQINCWLIALYSGLLRRYRGTPQATLVTMRINSEGVSLPCGNLPQRSGHDAQSSKIRFGSDYPLRRWPCREREVSPRRSVARLSSDPSALPGSSEVVPAATLLVGGGR